MAHSGPVTRRIFLRRASGALASLTTVIVLGACQSSQTAATSGSSGLAGAGSPKPGGAAASAAASASSVGHVSAPILDTLSGAERDRVAGLIQGAQKEGALEWLDAIVAPETGAAIGDAFKKAYGLTNLNIRFQHVQSGQLTAQVQQELTADKDTTDVFGVATPQFYADLKKASALMRYDSPEYQRYETAKKAGLPYEPGYWLAPVAYSFVPVVNPKTYPKPIQSWKDLLDPKLKGKMDFADASKSETSLYIYVGLRKVLPLSFFQQLAPNVLFSSGSSVQETQKVASGELLLAVTSAFRLTQTNNRTGVTLKAYYPQEGVTMLGQPYAILAKAPHPNAAKLLIDFLFSEAGQELYVGREGIISARDGFKIPAQVAQDVPSMASIKSIPIDWKTLDDKALKAARTEFQQTFHR